MAGKPKEKEVKYRGLSGKTLWLSLAILLVLVMITMVACGESDKNSPSATGPTGTNPAAETSVPAGVQTGGVVKIGYIGISITSLGDPTTMSGAADGQQSQGCIETLLRFDENNKLVPLLATEWKTDPANKTVTLTLRQGVKFHDGSEFNAEVVKWNMDRFRTAPGRVELKGVTAVDVIDNYTVRIKLDQWDSTFLNQLAYDGGRMISQKSFEANGQPWAEKNPVGTGPFKFVDWEKDVSVKYARFDDYWQEGKPYLDGLERLYFADQTTELMAFKTGELDIIVASNKNARDLASENKYQISIVPTGFQEGLGGDSANPDSPFADIRVRQAVSYALDLPTQVESLGYGYRKALNQWAVEGIPGYNPDVKGYPYNPDKARELLAEAGYPDGFTTDLHYLGGGPRDDMTALQQSLGAVGIKVNLVPQAWSAYGNMVSGGGWKNSICQVLVQPKSDVLDPMRDILSPGSQKFTSIVRPQEYTDLYVRALQAEDEATKQQLTWELGKAGTDEYCLITWLWADPIGSVTYYV